jgi:hypothetical protein
MIFFLILVVAAVGLMAVSAANRQKRLGRNWFAWLLIAMFVPSGMHPMIAYHLDKRWPPKARDI